MKGKSARDKAGTWWKGLLAWMRLITIVYKPRYLIKDIPYFAAFGLLAPVIGFILPSVEIYDLANRILLSGILDPALTSTAILALAVLNALVIRTFLLTKYAIKRQANAAMLFVFIILFALSFVGFWTRIQLASQAPDAEDLLGIARLAPKANLSPNFMAAIIAVALSLPLFSVVYGLAAGPYSKVDYAAFHSWTKSFFRKFDSIEERYKMTPPELVTESDVERLRKSMAGAVGALEDSIPLEPGGYGEFVKEFLYEPLRSIEEFFLGDEILSTPEVILELRKGGDPRRVTWEDMAELRSAYEGISGILK